MSSLKIRTVALVAAASAASILLSACSTVSDAWDSVTSDSDSSLRTPTGYYEHAESRQKADPLKVPVGLSTPYTDHSLDIPPLMANKVSQSFIGENADVRPPVIGQTSEIGANIVSNGDNAIVWFQPYGKLNVTTPQQAWTLLKASLSYLKIPVKKVDDQNYSIVTGYADYDSTGALYDDVSDDVGARRYREAFSIDVGYSKTPGLGQGYNQRQIGLFISLAGASIKDSDGDAVNDKLNVIQKRNFTVGFGNTIVNALAKQTAPAEIIPDRVQVLLGRDNNGQNAFIVNVPYEATWNVMRGVASNYSFTLQEYSVSRSSITFKNSEENADFYRKMGVSPVVLDSGKYIFRLGVNGNQTIITIYNEDDKPLDAAKVAALYPGISSIITKEFGAYKRDSRNYIAKLTQSE